MKWYVGLCLSFIFAIQAQAQVALRSLLNDKLYLHVKIDSSQKIIEADQLKKLYELNSYTPLWTEGGRANRSAQSLKTLLLKADDWGLTSSQYMTPDLQDLFNRVNDKNAITLEMLLSDAYLRFAQDLANGQLLDPDLIDEDIKMPRKKFEEH